MKRTSSLTPPTGDDDTVDFNFPKCYDRAIHELKVGNEIEIGDSSRGIDLQDCNSIINNWIKLHPEHTTQLMYALYSITDVNTYPEIVIKRSSNRKLVRIIAMSRSSIKGVHHQCGFAEFPVSMEYAQEFLRHLLNDDSPFVACGNNWGDEYL